MPSITCAFLSRTRANGQIPRSGGRKQTRFVVVSTPLKCPPFQSIVPIPNLLKRRPRFFAVVCDWQENGNPSQRRKLVQPQLAQNNSSSRNARLVEDQEAYVTKPQTDFTTDFTKALFPALDVIDFIRGKRIWSGRQDLNL